MPFTCDALRRYLEQEKGNISDRRGICKSVVSPHSCQGGKRDNKPAEGVNSQRAKGSTKDFTNIPGQNQHKSEKVY